MDTIITKRIDEWTTSPFDRETISEINDLVARGDEKELTDRFYTMLEFGTGGLRGIIGAGTNRMNIYTVGMATQGLANYIKSMGRENDGIVIARDSRRMSEIFATETAVIMAANGIKVYYFDDITPTPICSFAVRFYKAASGVVITASHNPPEYNGYKVYWDDGGQIVPPFDKDIIGEVRKITSISKIKKISFDEGITSGIIRKTDDDVINSYIENLERASFRRPGTSTGISIVYTPLHGTGYNIIPRVLNHFGFSRVFSVAEQSIPDGNFPTVDSPNPEEPKALSMAITLAEGKNADIVMATDPDADRMGIGFKDSAGNFQLINGNQIGTMLEYYLLQRLSEENRLPSNAAVIKTIVTTDLQERIARSYNCTTENVLTGFKWIAMKIKEYENNSQKRFVFGGEESYGYLPVDFVRDKDSVSSCYFFAEMTDWLKSKEITLEDYLNEIYLKYALYIEDLESITLKGIDGMERISRIMKTFRDQPPGEFNGIAVTRTSDIQNLTLTDAATGKIEPISDLPKSDVLQFFLEDGSKITMRPSGTEPKIKFYFSVNTPVTKQNIDSRRMDLKNKLEDLKNDLRVKISFAQPDH